MNLHVQQEGLGNRIRRSLFTSQSKPNQTTVAFRVPNGACVGILSPASKILLALALVFLCLPHYANGFSSSSCMAYSRVAVHNTHSIEAEGRKVVCHHVGSSHERYQVDVGRSDSHWSCLNLNKSSPRQPFLLRPTRCYRSRATVKGFPAPNESTSGKLKEGASDQKLRARRLGLIDNNIAIETSAGDPEPPTVLGEDLSTSINRRQGHGSTVRMQYRSLITTATVCIRHPQPTTSSAAIFSQIMLDRKSFSRQNTNYPHETSPASTAVHNHDHLSTKEVASWRCNSTILIREYGSGFGANSAAAETTSATDSPADSPGPRILSSSKLETTVSLQNVMQHEKNCRPSLLPQILEAVEGELRHALLRCDEHPDSEAGVSVDGNWRRRRRLMARYWPPLIVANLLIGALGVLCGGTALWRVVVHGCNSRPLVDDDDDLPATTLGRWMKSTLPEETSAVADGGPRRGSRGRSVVMEESRRRSAPRLSPDLEGEQANNNREDLRTHNNRENLRTHNNREDLRTQNNREDLRTQNNREDLRTQNNREDLRKEEEHSNDSLLQIQTPDPHAQIHTRAHCQVHPFCYEGLARATRGFDESNKLGAGSFGTVYRGLLFDGRVVAIKRADCSNLQKVREKRRAFKAEIQVMSNVHHKHLVNLVGYCDDRNEMMLVYEYMPNDTLSNHLHDKHHRSRTLSSWKVRIRVALQAARGIEYLHVHAMPLVIHRDIKSSNILLDTNWSVRVSDFGLSKRIFPSSPLEEDSEKGGSKTRELELEQCQGATRAVGTLGYMDPEYYHLQRLTTKSDVYSFGVVILELLTGKRAIHRRYNTHVSLVDYAIPSIEAGELTCVLDPRVRAPTSAETIALKVWNEVMAEVGKQCVRPRGKDRPSMTDIIRELEHAVTLCRSRRAPLPTFGAQLGSTTDPGSSSESGCPSPRSLSPDPSPGPLARGPRRLYSIDRPAVVGGFGSTDVDEEEDDGSIGTDVAQLGSLSTSQAHVLRDFLQGVDDEDFDYYYSDPDVDLGLQYSGSYYTPELDDNFLQILDDAAADSSNIESECLTTAASYGGEASGPDISIGSDWQRLHESWWHPRPRPESASVNIAGRNNNIGGLRASFVGGSGADYYNYNVVGYDPLLHQGAIMAGFANFGDSGPPVEFDYCPHPPHVEFRPQERGARERRVGYLDEQGAAAAAAGGLGGGRRRQRWSTLTAVSEPELERSPENYIGDIDIEEFLDGYSDEQFRSTSTYAAFVVNQGAAGVEDLMRALYTMQQEQQNRNSGREELDEQA